MDRYGGKRDHDGNELAHRVPLLERAPARATAKTPMAMTDGASRKPKSHGLSWWRGWLERTDTAGATGPAWRVLDGVGDHLFKAIAPCAKHTRANNMGQAHSCK